MHAAWLARRRLALRLFRETLAELEPQHLLRAAVRVRRQSLQIGRWAFAPPELTGVTVVALGKAAIPMAQAWLDQWRAFQAPPPLRCMVVAPASGKAAARTDGAWTALPGVHVRFFAGGHPLPNRTSLQAGRACLVAARRERCLLVALISGGGSALAEWPLGPRSLAEVRELYGELVQSGAPIGAINVIRKHLSAFKGGRLAAATCARVVSLVLSDVAPGDGLDAVASGPTLPDASTARQCAALIRRWLPHHKNDAIGETPKPGELAADAICLADNRLACERLAARARAHGLEPVIDHHADEWEYRRAARYLVERWRECRQRRACLIAGGEVRVRMPAGTRGRGGRNQALALQVATLLRGSASCFLSAGTDGVDGNSPAAGALVDGGTCERARQHGLDVARSLAEFDAYPVLAATGDAIETGPTGNNLRDLRLFL